MPTVDAKTNPVKMRALITITLACLCILICTECGINAHSREEEDSRWFKELESSESPDFEENDESEEEDENSEENNESMPNYYNLSHLADYPNSPNYPYPPHLPNHPQPPNLPQEPHWPPYPYPKSEEEKDVGKYDPNEELPVEPKEPQVNRSEGCVDCNCNCDETSAFVRIYRSLPNIPPEYANFLLNKDAGFLYYIITCHENLPQLLVNMDSKTLEYVIKSVPSVNEKISQMEAETLRSIIANISDIPAYLKNLEPSVLKVMVSKVPLLGELVPKPNN